MLDSSFDTTLPSESVPVETAPAEPVPVPIQIAVEGKRVKRKDLLNLFNHINFTEGTIFVNDAYCGTAPVVYPEALREKAKSIKPVYERVKGGPTQELCRAIRGEGEKPVSNFVDHSGPLTEMVLAGNLSLRLSKKIDWDAKGLVARGTPEADALIKRAYRKGWEPKLDS